MSIIILTPKPNNLSMSSNSVVDTNESIAARLTSDFLHLLGHEGHRFDTFEQLRDFAQAQIDAASLAARAAAPVAAAEPVAPTAAPAVAGDATNAVTGQPVAAEPESVVILTPPPAQP